MGCDPLTFENFSADKWLTAQREVQRQLGIRITTPNGQASEKGFTIAWDYDAAAQRLTITCVDKPFVVPCALINGQIAKLIREGGDGA